MIHVFVLNNYAGNKDRVGAIREYLASRKDMKYFIFNTLEAGSEFKVMWRVKKYFANEKIRVYACGGSGTFRNVVQGAGDDLTNMEFAFYPCGMSNDFLKAFPEGEDPFRSIDNLIDGKVVYLDYIRTNGGNCVNSASAGVDVAMSRYTEENKSYAMVNERLPYLFGTLKAAFLAKNKKLRVTVDGEVLEDDFGEVFFANGPVLGANIKVSEDKNITDGRGSAILMARRSGVRVLPTLSMLIKGDFESFKKQKNCYMKKFSKIKVEDLSGEGIAFNLDGEILDAKETWDIEIVQKGLPFVLPKGMQYEAERGGNNE